MDWGEAWRLLGLLLVDPEAQITAALAGWSHPIARSDITMRALYDLQHITKVKKKPKPYPRPWDAKPKRVGAGVSLSIDEFKAIKAGLTETVDVRRPRDALGRFVKVT